MSFMRTLELVPIALTWVAAFGCGFVAGEFFAFSAVMRALAQLPVPQAIPAVQCVNMSVLLNRWVLILFTGTAALCAAVVVGALVRGHSMQAILHISGGLLYLIGSYLVTVFLLVPRSEALSLLVVDDTRAAADAWNRYVRGWTTWNRVRTASAAAAALTLILALTSE
jgi:uncharacterized membrane protein